MFMSVIVSKRGKQDLQVLNSATELAAYTVNICANENLSQRNTGGLLPIKL